MSVQPGSTNISQFPGRAKQGRPGEGSSGLDSPRAGDKVLGEVPEPPEWLHLTRAGRKLWDESCTALILRYQLTEPGLALIASYAVAMDELVEAQRVLKRDGGSYLRKKNGELYPHPALKRRDKAQMEIRLHARTLGLIPSITHGTPETGDMFSDFE